MQKTFFLLSFLLWGVSGVIHAAEIGADLPLEDQTSVDGWAGVQVRFGENLPPGEAVTVVQYYADHDRTGDVEAGDFNFVPLIVGQEGGSFDGDGTFIIYDVGPVHIPTEEGLQVLSWGGGSLPVPDDGNLYHVGLLEWKNGINNSNGGLVSFGTDGTGMHFFDVDTSSYAPDDLGEVEVGFDLTNGAVQTHTSGAGGRDYQVVFTTSAEALPTPGDFNNDGTIDTADFQILVSNFHTSVDRGTNGDINFSASVDFKDFVAFRSAFEAAAAGGAAAAVPEPVAGLLGLCGALSALHFARRRVRRVSDLA